MNAAGGIPLPGAGWLDPVRLYTVYGFIVILLGLITGRVSNRIRIAAGHEFRRETEMYTKCLEQLQNMCAPPVKHHYMNIKFVLILLWAALFASLVLLTARWLTAWIGILPQIGVVRGTTAARFRAWATRNNYGRLRAFIWRLEQWMVNGGPPPSSVLFVALLGALCGAVMCAKVLRFFPRFK